MEQQRAGTCRRSAYLLRVGLLLLLVLAHLPVSLLQLQHLVLLEVVLLALDLGAAAGVARLRDILAAE
jgi:hypothetical protein